MFPLCPRSSYISQKSLAVSNRSPASTRLSERITTGFGGGEFQGRGWIQSLAKVIRMLPSLFPFYLFILHWPHSHEAPAKSSPTFRFMSSQGSNVRAQLLSPGSSSKSPEFGFSGLAEVTCLSVI